MQPKKDDNEEFITKVFTNNDRSLKLLGELLSNQVSRDIIRLLIEKEMYANEIASKLNTQFSLISHHIKKMEELGLLSINEKRIVKKGTLHKYYRMVPGLFILPDETKEEIKENGTLKKIFKKGIKITSIGISGIITWFGSQLIFNSIDESVIENDGGLEGLDILRPQTVGLDDFVLSIILTIVVMSIPTIILLYKKNKKG